MNENLGDALDEYLEQKARERVAAFARQQCCVCGKYGADEPFGEPLASLVSFALAHGLTLRLSTSRAIHPKCLKQLKALISAKQKT